MKLGAGSKLGPYTIVAELGRGGMGAVYRAKDERTGELVALKVLLPDVVSDARFLERFRREAAASRAITHPNVTKMRDTGSANGVSYVAFELVDGGTLDERLRLRGALPWRDAMEAGAHVARGLAAIHGAGLVHRDLKPSNVLLAKDGTPKIADLGLVRGSAPGMVSLTRTGELLGTAEYMAPEQAEGLKVDARADLYALGATLYALLTGRPPFEGRSFDVMRKHLEEVPPPPSERAPNIPPTVDAIVMRLLSKQPELRGASAAAIAEELDALARSSAGGRRGSVALVALVVLALAGLGGAFAWKGRNPPPSPPSPPTAPPTPPKAKEPPPKHSYEEPDWWKKLPSAERAPIVAGGPIAFSKKPNEYVNVKDGSILVWAPAARATIGNEDREYEYPVRENVPVEGFFIGKLEVTNEQYERFVKEARYPEEPAGYVLELPGGKKWVQLPGATWRRPDGNLPAQPQHPVVQVRHADALAYCAWAGLVLPTDVEWERAARWDGEKARTFPWGETQDFFFVRTGAPANVADLSFAEWVKGEVQACAADDGFATTSPVGHFAAYPSPVGMLDALGNVWEHCADIIVVERVPHCVLRGYGWDGFPKPVANARSLVPAETDLAANRGFRVAYRPKAK